MRDISPTTAPNTTPLDPVSFPNVPGQRIAYTLQNASDAVDLSVATLRRLNKAGRLRFIRIGGRTLVCARSLHALAGGQ